ncbi:MAG: 16S rRNA (cytidine(1402)-2'-O)-methyltransferase, partial [Burkholderiaceae bacterium]
MAHHSFPAGLYVAATPIGHLDDVSQRVREALTCCDRIYAEDTRRTQTLLHALGISRDRSVLHALHEHNEYTVRDEVIAAIEHGASVLIVSDAGTPAISDPGVLVVDAAWTHGVPISPLPGPTAVITALSVCG